MKTLLLLALITPWGVKAQLQYNAGDPLHQIVIQTEHGADQLREKVGNWALAHYPAAFSAGNYEFGISAQMIAGVTASQELRYNLLIEIKEQKIRVSLRPKQFAGRDFLVYAFRQDGTPRTGLEVSEVLFQINIEFLFITEQIKRHLKESDW